jgi:hypothetical protein
MYSGTLPGDVRARGQLHRMRAYKRSNVVLTLGQNAQANITFELAGTQQLVEVSASAPLFSFLLDVAQPPVAPPCFDRGVPAAYRIQRNNHKQPDKVSYPQFIAELRRKQLRRPTH